jgi:hypothetical protein
MTGRNTPPGALVTRKDPLEYLRKLRFFAQAARRRRPRGLKTEAIRRGGRDLDRWRLQAQPGPGRLGGDPALRRAERN